MIHIFVGTKAQFIKMAPIVRELCKRNIAYNFIDAGQHSGLTMDFVRQFELKPPDVRLRKTRNNITTMWQAFNWFFVSMVQLFFKKQNIFNTVFRCKNGVVLIHGDTLTTLISLLYAKRCGLKVAHVEAGLRSYHLFDPFPEEIIRLVAMKYSDILFAPSSWAYRNLEKMGYAKKAVDIGGNTGMEAAHYAVLKGASSHQPNQPYVVFTIHRVETIYSRSRLSMVIELVEKISNTYIVLFVIHEPTHQQLKRFNLYERLRSRPSVMLYPLQPYVEFINLLAGATFVVSDGGSIQEESFFLNVPCLIMRAKTERMEGIGENAFLSDFDGTKIQDFIQSFMDFKRKDDNSDLQPSSAIVSYILPFATLDQ